MTELAGHSLRADRYVRGELDDAELGVFEAELIESPELQDAVEVALALRRVAQPDSSSPLAGVTPVPPRAKVWPRWQAWSLAASLGAAAVLAVLMWQADTRNARLQVRIAELSQPVGQVLTVPLDIMRSADPRTPDLRIRKPAGAAILVLDIEIGAPMSTALALELELSVDGDGTPLRWTATPDADGRVQLALRSDLLPDGLLSLTIQDRRSGTQDHRVIEVLPAQ